MIRIIAVCLAVVGCFAGHKVLIGIAGGTGSGKTTLAQQIRDNFKINSILISQDAYYKDLSHLPHEERAKANFDHPNSIDFNLLHEHLCALKEGKAIEQPIYDFATHSRKPEKVQIEAVDLIIVEGILLFAIESVRSVCDLKIFIDTDHDIRMLRRIERDIKERGRDFAGVKEQYLTTVKPMHDAFVEPSKVYADVIIPGGGYNLTAISFIVAKLSHDLAVNGKSIEEKIKRFESNLDQY
ncbi:MAG: uridine kinase [Chlamydiae bacterium RIFCSPHIGHO2_12_FULL_49_11]|nr:MAG: uridine kinase [Chlamydiae bacterium RIFCSPHIGHO2_12_FULL_49_11]